MSEISVLVRDRADRRIIRIRTRAEPAKLRVCRRCRAVHAPRAICGRAA